MALEPIKLGWKALGEWLNKLVAVVNLQTPIAGAGITCEPAESGTIISLTPPSSTSADPTTAAGNTTQINASTGGGAGGASQSDMDALIARVAALEAILAGSSWGNVDVMNTSCVRSTISILSKPAS